MESSKFQESVIFSLRWKWIMEYRLIWNLILKYIYHNYTQIESRLRGNEVWDKIFVSWRLLICQLLFFWGPLFIKIKETLQYWIKDMLIYFPCLYYTPTNKIKVYWLMDIIYQHNTCVKLNLIAQQKYFFEIDFSVQCSVIRLTRAISAPPFSFFKISYSCYPGIVCILKCYFSWEKRCIFPLWPTL